MKFPDRFEQLTVTLNGDKMGKQTFRHSIGPQTGSSILCFLFVVFGACSFPHGSEGKVDHKRRVRRA
jgi:hypothetical protein